MLFLKLVLVAYLIAVVFAFLMASSAIDSKSVRRIFLLLGLVMPFVFVYAVIVSLFSSRKMIPFSLEMGSVEDRIEAERVRIFGGEFTTPSFSDRWKSAYEIYIEKLAQKAAKTSEKIISLGCPSARRI